MRKRTRRLLFALASLVVALVLAESAIRVRQWKRYGTAGKSLYEFTVDPVTKLRIPTPNSHHGPIAINSLGFRGPEIERPKPPGRIRVAFLGASTTFCAEASSQATTWPVLVFEGLRAAAPDLEFDYVNGSAGGFTAEQSLLNLEQRVAPLEPDVIVYYEATNDLTVDTRRAAIQAGLWEAPKSDHSEVGDLLLLYYLIEKNVLQFLRSRPDDEPKLQFDPRELSRGFEERLTKLVTAAQARCEVVALVTFAIHIRATQPSEVQRAAAASAFFYMPFMDIPGLLAGYAEYNRVIRTVAEERGAILIEGEDTIPGDAEHFRDSVHMVDPGLRLQAERVLEGLLAAPAYQALLARRRASGH
jgi:hypothetical protein